MTTSTLCQTSKFQSYLWRGGKWAHYWTDSGKESLWFPVVNPAPIPAKWDGQNVYFGVHPCREIPPINSKCEPTQPRAVRVQNDYVAAVNCFFAEFDAKDFKGGKDAILAHLDSFPQTLDLPFPSVIVDSGGGFHCYWLLEHTVTVTDDNRAYLRGIQAAWVQRVGGDEASKDFARMLRVPGTLNLKSVYGPDFPTVTVVEEDYRRLYRLEDFEKLTEHLRRQPDEQPPMANSYPYGQYTFTDDLTKAADNLKRLRPGRADDYEEWVNVGMALSGLGAAGLGMWEDWSRQSSKYTPGECVKKWPSFIPGDGLGLGSLSHWADEDDPSGKSRYVNGHRAGLSMPIDVNTQAHHAEIESTAQLGEADKERFTDLGNTRRFVRLYGNSFRYTQQWGWLSWTGQRWEKDTTGQVMRAAKCTATGLYTEAARIHSEAEALLLTAGGETATEEQRAAVHRKADNLSKLAKAMTAWAQKSQARARLESIVKLSQSELPIATKTDDFDALPWTLNVKNGTIDLRTGQLRPHNHADMLTSLAAVHYDPEAPCPLWLAFLHRIMGGSAEMLEFLQRIVGYALTGDVSEQVLFFLHGGGSNGKSTFVNTLLSILGEDYAIQAAPELLVVGKDRHPTEVADLYGKRLVASIEVEDGRRMAEGLVKQMTGGDKIKARWMRQDFFQFDPTHKLFLVANHKPVVKGTDYAIWRRIKLIPFDVTITDAEKDPVLPDKLKGEAPGILAWAVQGCLEWQRRGLAVPDTVRAATEAYRVESDTLSAFIEEYTVMVDNARAKASDLYKAYQNWCEDNGEHPMNGTQFGRKLTERGFDKTKNYLGVFYLGVGLSVHEQD